MIARAVAVAVVLVLALAEATALAQDVAARQPEPRGITLSGSVLMLNAEDDRNRINMVELTGELPLGDRVGVAGIVGAGRIISAPGDVEYHFTALDLGAQLHYYLIGDFEHGMQIGAEALVLAMRGVDQYNGSMQVQLGAVMAGPYLGYKIVAPTGFTALAQAGIAAVGTAVDASHQPTEMEFSDTAAQLAPLVNLNLGWSF